MIYDIVVNKWGYKLFFVESICDDPQIIEQNIMVSEQRIKQATDESCLLIIINMVYRNGRK